MRFIELTIWCRSFWPPCTCTITSAVRCFWAIAYRLALACDQHTHFDNM